MQAADVVLARINKHAKYGEEGRPGRSGAPADLSELLSGAQKEQYARQRRGARPAVSSYFLKAKVTAGYSATKCASKP